MPPIAAIHVTLEEKIVEQAAEEGRILYWRVACYHSPLICYVFRYYWQRLLQIGQHFVNNDIGYEIAAGLFKRGVLISGTLNNSRVEPPLIIMQAEIDTVLNTLKGTHVDLCITPRGGGTPNVSLPLVPASAQHAGVVA